MASGFLVGIVNADRCSLPRLPSSVCKKLGVHSTPALQLGVFRLKGAVVSPFSDFFFNADVLFNKYIFIVLGHVCCFQITWNKIQKRNNNNNSEFFLFIISCNGLVEATNGNYNNNH